MEINKFFSQPNYKLGFKGYQHARTNEGNQALRFNYVFDSDNYDCEVEFYKVKRNPRDFSYSLVRNNEGKANCIKSEKMQKGGIIVDTGIDGLNLKDGEAVAYRYKLTNRHNPKEEPIYVKDDADGEHSYIEGNEYNLVRRNGPSPVVQGPMSLQIPDTYNTGYIYAGFNAENTGEIIADPNAKNLDNFSRSFSNKAGGTIAGMEKKLPEMREIGYKKAISLPTTGADTLSSHRYWPTRPFQTENIDGWNSYITSCFKNGISYVTDEALTSQGLEGVNFRYALKWMNQEDKPHEYYMFRMQGLEDAALGLGEVPANMQNLRHKIVNGKHDYKEENGIIKLKENPDYDANLPTYIQIYDDSLVSDEQRNDKKHIIRDYAKTNPTYVNEDGSEDTNTLAINLHDDTLVPYVHQIDPDEYDANIKNLNIINQNRSADQKIARNSELGTLILGKFSSIEIRPKEEGGFQCWDANTDMAKLSYGSSDYDVQLLQSIQNPKERAIEFEKLERAHAGNRDVLAENVRFYARNVRLLQNEYTAKTLGSLKGKDVQEIEDRINSLVYNKNDRKLPYETALNTKQIENINENWYSLRPKNSDLDETLNRALMEYPLDAVELEDDVVGALSSPYLSKRSPDMEHVGESRYDAMYDKTYHVPEKYSKTYNKMNDVYTKQMNEFAKKVLYEVDKKSPEKLFKDSDTLTEYGQYVVPLVAQDIAKYAIIKSLVPSAATKELKGNSDKHQYQNLDLKGHLTYDYETLKRNATLKSMGIVGDSPEDEANQIISKMREEISQFSSNDVRKVAHSISTRIEGTDAKSFRFAEAMVEKAGLGLEVRVDAAKDYADMDAVRALQDTADNQYVQDIDILSPMVKALKDENPSSTLYAEYTDADKMMKATYGDTRSHLSSFGSDQALEGKVLSETGINTVANYSYFFTGGLNIFGQDFTDGNERGGIGQFIESLNNFANMPEEFKRNTYTFGGNHDKPRMTECYGMDMGLFFSNLTEPKNKDYRKKALMIINNRLGASDITDEDKKIIEGSSRPNFFNNISAKSIAKAEWMKSSIGIANHIMKNEELANAGNDEAKKEQINKKYDKAFTSIGVALSALAQGEYYMNGNNANKDSDVPDSYKKQLEKDGFGAKDFPTAFNIIMNQAKHNTNPDERFPEGIDMKRYKDLTMKAGLGIPLAKTRMYTQLIYALPGNPTIFAGDDLGMTGYDEKCHNWYLSSRNRTPWELAETNEMIKGHKKIMDGIVATRKNDVEHRLAPLNGGTMYKLVENNSKEGHVCPAILAQDSDGSMVVSVFNYSGDLHRRNLGEVNTEKQLNKAINDYHIENADIDSVKIVTDKTGGKTIKLPAGLVFKNIDSSDPSVYKTKEENGQTVIKRYFGDKETHVTVNKDTAPEGVLRLYYQPKSVEQEIDRVKALEDKYTKVTNPIAKAYQQAPKTEVGQNLSIESK